eukprot:GEMP01031580.1.p1 GENE.GEMP01031580.1~~GEMP01031580.1.p1  ORF type:complete len:283 (+),score=57.71 GEMP01031580.1:128-976(+)
MTHRFVISLEDTEEQCLRYKNEVMGLFARLGFPNTFNAQFDAIATKSTSRSVSPAPIISPPSAPSAPAPPCPTPMHPNKIPTAPSCAPSPSRNQWRRRSPARPTNGPPRRQPANVDRHPVLRGANLVPVGPSPVANINKPACNYIDRFLLPVRTGRNAKTCIFHKAHVGFLIGQSRSRLPQVCRGLCLRANPSRHATLILHAKNDNAKRMLLQLMTAMIFRLTRTWNRKERRGIRGTRIPRYDPSGCDDSLWKLGETGRPRSDIGREPTHKSSRKVPSLCSH